MKDDDDRRTADGNVVGRRLESSHELTCAEADQVFAFVRQAPPGYDFVTGEVVPEGVGTDPTDYTDTSGAGQWMQPGEVA